VKTKLHSVLALIALVAFVGCAEPEGQSTATAPQAAAAPAASTTAPSTEAPEARALANTSVPPAARIDVAQADAVSTDLAAAGYREGTHYVRLSPTQPTSSSPDQVEVAEFFMYSCIHCYNFEPFIEQWLPGTPDYVNFVRVPTAWNATVRLHAQAFYAAAALNKGEEMHTPFFREMHVTGNYMQSKDTLADFFDRFGVDESAFDSAFESFSVNTSLRRADELARRYAVDSTPTVVVNGKYRTNASMAGGYPELLALIDALAAAENAEN
jgi:thiol:disulfide interchange protein DsbA